MTEKKTEKKEMKKNETSEVLMFTPVIETVGTRLKKCREGKKIKLSQVSKALCIRESFLVSLEEGEYEVFPALVYAGGFLRSYAVYLGMDEKEVMQQFHKETEYLIEKSTDVPVAPNKNIIPSRKLLFSLLLLIGVGYGLVCFMKSKENEEIVVEKTPVTVSVEEVSVPEKVEVAPVQEINSEVVAPQMPVEDVDAVLKEQKEEVLSESEELENPFTGTVFGQKEGARVSVLATDTVWMEVKSAGKVIFTRMLQKGDSYNAPVLDEPAVLKAGNAGAVSIYIDGKFKKVLGRAGHVSSIKLDAETLVD